MTPKIYSESVFADDEGFVSTPSSSSSTSTPVSNQYDSSDASMNQENQENLDPNGNLVTPPPTTRPRTPYPPPVLRPPMRRPPLWPPFHIPSTPSPPPTPSSPPWTFTLGGTQEESNRALELTYGYLSGARLPSTSSSDSETDHECELEIDFVQVVETYSLVDADEDDF